MPLVAPLCCLARSALFFCNDTATTEIYTLSLHDALPICSDHAQCRRDNYAQGCGRVCTHCRQLRVRSEEHTSELQSQFPLVCRLLLEKSGKTEQQHCNLFKHKNHARKESLALPL